MHDYQRCGVSIYSFLLSRGLYPCHSSWASTKNHLASELAVTTPEEREVRTGSRHLLPFESVLFQCELYLMKIQGKSCLSGTRQSPHPQIATFTCRNISGISYMYVVPKDCAWNLLDWSRSLVTYGVLINIPCNGPCLSPYVWNMICKKKRMAWGIKRQEEKKKKKSHELPKVTFFHKCYFLKHIFGELNS